MRKYLLNSFILLIPIFLWNILFIDYLPKGYSPEVFDEGIPKYIIISENVLRFFVFTLPLFIPLSIKTKIQKTGFLIYFVGVLLYFSSWLMVIFYPESDWSQSLIGFTAPAYTTIIWFIGIGLIGNNTFFKSIRLSLIYIFISVLFVVFHALHAYIVFQNLIE